LINPKFYIIRLIIFDNTFFHKSIYFVISLLIILAILFALDKIRPDYIAMAALVLLILSGTLSAVEAQSAFGSTTVVLVAVLFIIGQVLPKPV
jgi:hypothetical protein